MSRAAIALRVVLLPVVLGVGVVLYGLALQLTRILMPTPAEGTLTIAILIGQGFLAATLNAALACYPLARLYGRAAVGVALLITLPVLAISHADPTPARHLLATFLHAWELGCFVLLLVGATWLAQRRLQARPAGGSAP